MHVSMHDVPAPACTRAPPWFHRCLASTARLQVSLADDGVRRVTQNGGREAIRLHNCKNKAATSKREDPDGLKRAASKANFFSCHYPSANHSETNAGSSSGQKDDVDMGDSANFSDTLTASSSHEQSLEIVSLAPTMQASKLLAVRHVICKSPLLRTIVVLHFMIET